MTSAAPAKARPTTSRRDTTTAVARAKGKLKGKQPKLTPRQQPELTRMHATGEYTMTDLMEVFSVGRATVYRTLERAAS
jgi:DNA invertase Pin-like site-specific DNA recombinase